MSSRNVEALRRAEEAINRDDIEGLLAEYAADAVLRDLESPPDVPPEARGHDAIRSVFQAWTGIFDEFHADIVDVVSRDEFVVAEVHWRGRGKGSGLDVDLHQFDVYEFRDGKIVAATLTYRRREDALAAAGIDEEGYSQPRRRK